GVEPSLLLELFCNLVIARCARRLPLFACPGEPEPRQILSDGICILLGGALAVGIVEPQDELAIVLACKQPVEYGRAHISDVQAASGTWGKTDGNGHGRQCSCSRSTRRLISESDRRG